MKSLLSVRHSILVFFALCSLMIISECFAQIATDTNGLQNVMVRSEGITKISEHVYVIPDQNLPAVPNVGIVVGDTATLVIDTGMGDANGARVYEAATALTIANKNKANQLYVVTTHIHPEHDLGANGFPSSTKMIRSQAQQEEIAADNQRIANLFRQRSEAMRELLEGAEFREADITFTNDYRLDLGGVNVMLHALGPNHTLGDTAIYVPEDGVLFSGDIVMPGLPSFVGTQSNLAHWFGSLDFLESLNPKLIIPSHGAAGDMSLIAAYRDYLTLVQTRTHSLKAQGFSLAATTEKVIAELKATYPDTQRIGGAVRAAYVEAP